MSHDNKINIILYKMQGKKKVENMKVIYEHRNWFIGWLTRMIFQNTLNGSKYIQHIHVYIAIHLRFIVIDWDIPGAYIFIVHKHNTII